MQYAFNRIGLCSVLATLVACTGDIGAGGDPPNPNNMGTGGATTQPLKCVASQAPSVGVSPLRRLTRSQYNNTVRDLLGINTTPAVDFALDEKVGPFFSNASAPISDLLAEQFLKAAESLADTAVTSKLATMVPCDPATGDAACGAKFVDTFGLRAFRRPLQPDERASMVALFESGRTTVGFAEGVQRVIQAMLQSPQFLYHYELGQQPAGAKDVVNLDSYILAERMAYYL